MTVHFNELGPLRETAAEPQLWVPGQVYATEYFTMDRVNTQGNFGRARSHFSGGLAHNPSAAAATPRDEPQTAAKDEAATYWNIFNSGSDLPPVVEPAVPASLLSLATPNYSLSPSDAAARRHPPQANSLSSSSRPALDDFSSPSTYTSLSPQVVDALRSIFAFRGVESSSVPLLPTTFHPGEAANYAQSGADLSLIRQRQHLSDVMPTGATKPTSGTQFPGLVNWTAPSPAAGSQPERADSIVGSDLLMQVLARRVQPVPQVNDSRTSRLQALVARNTTSSVPRATTSGLSQTETQPAQRASMQEPVRTIEPKDVTGVDNLPSTIPKDNTRPAKRKRSTSRKPTPIPKTTKEPSTDDSEKDDNVNSMSSKVLAVVASDLFNKELDELVLEELNACIHHISVRRKKNRESASRKRRKNKAAVDELEEKVGRLAEENGMLVKRVEQLTAVVQAVEKRQRVRD